MRRTRPGRRCMLVDLEKGRASRSIRLGKSCVQNVRRRLAPITVRARQRCPNSRSVRREDNIELTIATGQRNTVAIVAGIVVTKVQ